MPLILIMYCVFSWLVAIGFFLDLGIEEVRTDWVATVIIFILAPLLLPLSIGSYLNDKK